MALVLAGRGNAKFPDSKVGASAFELSQSITKQIMKTVRSGHINITEVSIDLLNDACGLLGDHRNLEDLEVSIPISTWETLSNKNSTSGFSPHYGSRATHNHPGRPPPWWELADGLWRPNSARATRARRLPSAKIYAIIFGAYGGPSTPRLWICLFCSHPSTQLLATIVRRC